MNKRISILLGLIILLNIYFLPSVQAASPSPWASSEVTKAMEQNLVPDHLKQNYQTSIKRYEYVLLALEVVDKAGISKPIEQEFVFSDIMGHAYETEIIRAYNLGLIKGDGKGHFFPNNTISRQEVAVLVVNLLKVLDPKGNYVTTNPSIYADAKKIAVWSKSSIDYCYANSIIKGTGNNSLNQANINPLGTASIEEAITLLYRVAVSKSVVNLTSVGSVTIDPSELVGSSSVAKQVDITQFSKNFTPEVAQLILGYNDSNDILITYMSDDRLELMIGDATITLSKLSNGRHLDLDSVGTISVQATNVFTSILEAVELNSTLRDKVIVALNSINGDKKNYSAYVEGDYSISSMIDASGVSELYTVRFFSQLK